MFYLSSARLEQLNLKEGLRSDQAGALSTFEGYVRNHHNGKEVLALEYEVFEPLCQAEAQKIFHEAKKQFKIIDLRCFHRVGKLNVGDMAVWVGVTAAHRDEAFPACRYIIDEVKKRLPIWKKEYYRDGDAGWVNSGSTEHNSSLT